MIPFVFHYWIKPKSNESPKWKNSISILEENLPSIRRKKRIIFLWFMRFYKKMKFSRNARKFFTYILIVSMLIVQFVDFQASKYAKEHLNEATSIRVENTQPRNSTCLAIKHKTSAMLLRSHTTPFWAFNLCLIITLAISPLAVTRRTRSSDAYCPGWLRGLFSCRFSPKSTSIACCVRCT